MSSTVPPEVGGLSLVERFYEMAKRGEWSAVLAGWRWSPSFARECAHHVKPSSGWTFAHQAAFTGDSAAAMALVAAGADLVRRGVAGETPADVARRAGHLVLAAQLDVAAEHGPLWAPPTAPGALPSSARWDEARPRVAAARMSVAYGGGRVEIAPGDAYWVDSFERTLVGWHGTFSPPRGMDGSPLVPDGSRHA